MSAKKVLVTIGVSAVSSAVVAVMFHVMGLPGEASVVVNIVLGASVGYFIGRYL